jgi:hypothetical protein
MPTTQPRGPRSSKDMTQAHKPTITLGPLWPPLNCILFDVGRDRATTPDPGACPLPSATTSGPLDLLSWRRRALDSSWRFVVWLLHQGRRQRQLTSELICGVEVHDDRVT